MKMEPEHIPTNTQKNPNYRAWKKTNQIKTIRVLRNVPRKKKHTLQKKPYKLFVPFKRDGRKSFLKKKPLKPATTLLHKSKARLKSVEQWRQS